MEFILIGKWEFEPIYEARRKEMLCWVLILQVSSCSPFTLQNVQSFKVKKSKALWQAQEYLAILLILGVYSVHDAVLYKD